MSIRRFVPLSAVALLLASGFSHAATLLDDKFDDLDRTDGADLNDSQWYVLTNSTPTTLGASTGALFIERTTSAFGVNPHFVTTFASQLLNSGDQIKLSFDFKSAGGAAASGLRFGLYNSGGTNLTGDIFGPNTGASPATGTTFQDDLGYTVWAPLQGTQAIELRSRPSNTTANTTQIATAANGTVIGSTANLVATNTSDFYAASIQLERTDAGYNYEVVYAGTTLTGSTGILNTSTFDTFSIFNIVTTNQPFTVDNVLVSYSAAVPEPAAFGMLAMGAGLFLRRRR